MIKFTSTSDFDFGVESVSLVTDSSQLVKRASCKDDLKFEKTKGQTDMHIIALGSYEGVGYNRNVDRFLEKWCQQNFGTFKESGRAVHRHHKNKPKDPKYGNIKAAAYNKNMKRIELVVGLDDDKCQDILHEQETKGHTNWSMASKQPYDTCTWCGHKARSDKDRCEHIPRQLGELNKQGEVCGMDNHDPKWFEISYVHRPADRIGQSLKMASASELRPMLTSDYLQIYTGFEPPRDEFLISKKAEDKRSMLFKLAEMEKHIDAMSHSAPKTSKDLFLARHAAKLNKGDKLSSKTIDELRKFEPSKLLKVMADNGIILRPDEFSKYLFGDRVKEENVEGMKSHLPSVFRNLKESPAEAVNDEKFEPSSMDAMPKEIKDIVSKLFEGHSLFGKPAHRRVIRITMMCGDGAESMKPAVQEQTKSAFDKKLAETYASYKIAALNYLQEKDKLDEDLMWNAVIQNRG